MAAEHQRHRCDGEPDEVLIEAWSQISSFTPWTAPCRGAGWGPGPRLGYGLCLCGAEIPSHRGKSLERGVQSGRKPATVANLCWAS